MLVKDFMQTDLLTVESNDSIYDALKTFKEKNIRRMPVVDNGKLVGIVTRKALREASPSKATTLSVHELNYLLSKMTIKDVMKKKVRTITKETPIETAGMIMHQEKIGGLPVMEGKKLIGYISSNDLFAAIVKINGLDKPVGRISLRITVDQWQDAVVKCTGHISQEGCQFKMMSLMDIKDSEEKLLIFRFKVKGNIDAIAENIKKDGYTVVSVIKDVKLV